MKINPEDFEGFSRAMHSTWHYHQGLRTLFDCGEGCSLYLGSRVFAVERVLLTHGHLDHIAALPNLLLTRDAGRGDNTKPIDIYYPACPNIDALQIYIEKLNDELKYPLKWNRLLPGDRIAVSNGYFETFQTKHYRWLSLGYRYVEQRKKLKPEYNGLPGQELVKLKTAGTTIDMVIESPEFLITGDTSPMLLPSAKTVFHECTFYNPDDVKHQNHTELNDIQIPVGAENLVLYHCSSRYPVGFVCEAIRKRNFQIPVWLWYESRLLKI